MKPIQSDLILLHAPHVYDFRQFPQLYGPVSDLVPSTPVFEMYPLGFTTLAEHLEKAGYRVRVVNLAYRMLHSRRFDAEAFIKQLDAPVFGIDLHWLVHAHGAIEVARLVKKHHPGARVIMGGFSASYFARELIAYPEVDAVMRGDTTEEPMREYLRVLKTRRFGSVPNLVWKDSRGAVHENELSCVPESFSGLMQDNYGRIIRQVIRYRDLLSVVPFRGWLSYPLTAVFTCRGCTRNCAFCGGASSAQRRTVGRPRAALRSPEEIAADIRRIARFSHAPISVLGDIRQLGDDNTFKLLWLLHQKQRRNTLLFELFTPAQPALLREMALAAPGFAVDISPHSHDPEVRRALGLNYTNHELEETIANALRVGASRVQVYFMIGLPHQDRESVRATVAYCAYLLRKFDGDRRLLLYIGPLAPFLDPGSPGFEEPRKHGYKVLYHTLEEYRTALARPSWKHTLNYETRWLTRQDIIELTYESIAELTRLKANYGQIARGVAEAQLERLAESLMLERRIDALLAEGKEAELAALKPEMDRLNRLRPLQQRQMEVSMGLVRLRLLNVLGDWLWEFYRGLTGTRTAD